MKIPSSLLISCCTHSTYSISPHEPDDRNQANTIQYHLLESYRHMLHALRDEQFIVSIYCLYGGPHRWLRFDQVFYHWPLLECFKTTSYRDTNLKSVLVCTSVELRFVICSYGSHYGPDQGRSGRDFSIFARLSQSELRVRSGGKLSSP